MTSDVTDAEIEAVARAMAVGNGVDPDERFPDCNGRSVPAWLQLRVQAQTHIAAYRACRALDQSWLVARQQAMAEAARASRQPSPPEPGES